MTDVDKKREFLKKVISHYERHLMVSQPDSEEFDRLTVRFYKKNISPLLPQNKHSHILELGCGFGHFLTFLRHEGYSSLHGVDLSEFNVSKCREQGFEIGYGDAISYLENTEKKYDVICLFHLIEHYEKEDALNLLELAKEKLLPGGRVIMITPNMGNFITSGRGRYSDLTHVCGYTEESATFLLNVAGFEKSKVLPVDIYLLDSTILNTIGRLGFNILSGIMKIIYFLNGIKTITVLSKNMVVYAEKNT